MLPVTAAKYEADRIWAIVLAGGQGRRLSSLTRALYGYALPKQFACIEDGRSLLHHTMRRIAPVAAPERTVVIVGRAYGALARRQLMEFPGVDLVMQPADLGTAPGILLPLSRILARNPGATVAVFPCDHHLSRPLPFLSAVAEAGRLASSFPERLTLLAAVPDRPETEYGWIRPGPAIENGAGIDLRHVAEFVEKPDSGTARKLFAEGGLWNTFVIVGKAERLWRLCERCLPDCVGCFRPYADSVGGAHETAVLQNAYRRMPPADFSREVLQRAGGLAVLPVLGSGWTDWGSPERVARTLRGEDPAARKPAAAGSRSAVLTLLGGDEHASRSGGDHGDRFSTGEGAIQIGDDVVHVLDPHR
jgi:mannose-1-phosphate guanylyltransferase